MPSVQQTMLEKAFQTAFLKRLRALPRSYFAKLSDRSTIGLPDISGIVNGYPIALELKTNSEVTEIQLYTLRKIERAGGFAAVVSPENVEEVFQFLKELSEEEPRRAPQISGCAVESWLVRTVRTY